MIKRIVKMTFQESEIDAFLDIFESVEDKIRQFPGCQHLELWQNTAQTTFYLLIAIGIVRWSLIIIDNQIYSKQLEKN